MINHVTPSLSYLAQKPLTLAIDTRLFTRLSPGQQPQTFPPCPRSSNRYHSTVREIRPCGPFAPNAHLTLT
ncbi:hypothetical protein G7K_5907-t1 [Saitoella complicata NRRL Y-17804]|uniref:Uncharacterized protein n=1 Tax=Saitoella complicata (strain BCRC 22490 / CBS 7301 / JCM 7358 / NBRC 10748 / NRRL Y-17804) TaxID=698492 RepID=A0A0E9NQ44_SAICN|nr:hypothetical protein G7K_5907-t1 [Saitoella complicata NRRL Y-17804]